MSKEKELLEALLGDGTVAYHVALAKAFGSVQVGLWLSQSIFWQCKSKYATKIEHDGCTYFECTVSDFYDQTGLSAEQQTGAKDKLKQFEVLKEKRFGLPSKLYYHIDLEALATVLYRYYETGKAVTVKYRDKQRYFTRTVDGKFRSLGAVKHRGIIIESIETLESNKESELTRTNVRFDPSTSLDASDRSVDCPGGRPAESKPTSDQLAGFAFEDFWQQYDFKKGSKANAQKKWAKLTAAEISAIKDILEIYKRETVTEDGKKGEKFKPMRKHPEFFLAAKTWEAYAEQAKEEASRPADEWDEPYQKYVAWVKSRYPNVSKTAAYLTKQEYVCHKTQNYVRDMVYIGQENIQNMLIRAHDSFEAGHPQAAQCGSVFAYQIHLLQERVKSRSV